ncbi:TetR/AcrR family transcriptional regulator [Flindersiella endophytica]
MTPKKIRSEDSDVNRRPGSRDAAANRRLILAVADEVFSTGGETASTEEVARLAGVGIGTVFRHFPTKTALLQAVLERRFDGLRKRADAAGAERGALHGFFAYAVADAPAKLTIAEAFLESGGDRRSGQEATNALRSALARLLVRAREAGDVRADVDPDQLYALLIAASRAAAPAPHDAELRDRILGIVFRGLATPPDATS